MHTVVDFTIIMPDAQEEINEYIKKNYSTFFPYKGKSCNLRRLAVGDAVINGRIFQSVLRVKSKGFAGAEPPLDS